MNNLPAGNKQIKIRIPDTSILPFGKVIFLSAESKIELRNILELSWQYVMGGEIDNEK